MPNTFIKLSSKLLGKFSPIDYKYAKAIVGTYSWYDSSQSCRELGYKIQSIEDTFNDIEKYIKQTDLKLEIFNYKKFTNKNLNLKKIRYITGFPGWLANRAIEKIIDNIENQKNNFAFDKIILLVQKKYIQYLPNLPNYFEIKVGDLCDLESLRNSLNNVSCVWHLAGTIYPKNPEIHYKVNFEGTKNLTIACIEKDIKRFLYMSTDSVCGTKNNKNSFFNEVQKYKPYKDYGKSKYYAEKLLFDLNKKGLLNVTVFRGFWFFGPNMPERNKKFMKSFLWPYQIVFGNGQNFRSITHLDDLIQAFMMASEISKLLENGTG